MRTIAIVGDGACNLIEMLLLSYPFFSQHHSRIRNRIDSRYPHHEHNKL